MGWKDAAAASENREEHLARIRRHDLRFSGTITNPYEGFILGNGDVGACVNLLSHEFSVVLGKNDAWDARYDSITEEDVLKHDDLIRYEREYGFSWKIDADSHHLHTQDSIEWENKPEGLYVPYESKDTGRTFPSPKRIGYIKVQHPGYSNTQVDTRVNILHGILETIYTFPSGGKLIVEMFVRRDANAVHLRLTAEGRVPWVRLVLGKQPDSRFRDIPLPELARAGERLGIVSQRIPGEYDVPEFRWHLAGKFPDAHAKPLEEWALEFRQVCLLNDGDSVQFQIGIATDRDGEGSALERASALAEVSYEEAFAPHARAWEDFWQRSSIRLEDAEMEAVWYRDLFGYGCLIGKDANYPGLQANVPTDDISPFFGYYTWNHNVQKWCLPALPTGHPEWIESYADNVERHMEMFRYMARLIFGLDGVFCVHGTIPYVPAHRSFVNNKWGRALAMTGWVGQPLWWHWEYTRDVNWLRERAYPYLREAAIFYWNYLEKYQDESGDIYPSIRLEEPGWCRGFIGNRNVITDLVMFRKAFEWAVAAAEVLDADADWVERWREGIRRVPDIEYGVGPDGEGWVALDKHWMTEDFESFKGRVKSGFTDETDSFRYRTDVARKTRWGGVGFAVFPGEVVDGDEETGLAPVIRDMLSRSDVSRPMFTITKPHAITSILPRIRLGLRQDYDKIRQMMINFRFANGQQSGYEAAAGDHHALIYKHNLEWRYQENKYFGVMATTKMLLQSQGNIIRLFPFWPEHLAASFDGLRARGGFRVSSEWVPGRGIGAAVIASDAGEVCRLRWTSDAPPVIRQGDGEVRFERHGNLIVFNTEPGAVYELRPAD